MTETPESLTVKVNWDSLTPDELRVAVGILLESYIADAALSVNSDAFLSVEGFAMYIPYARGWDEAQAYFSSQIPKGPEHKVDP